MGMIKRLWFRLRRLVNRIGLVVTLVILIALSIAMSLALWHAPGRESTTTNSDADDQLVAAKPMSVVYGFNQLLVADNDGNVSSVVDFRPVTNKIVKQIKKWKVGDVKTTTISKSTYVRELTAANAVVLSFPDLVPANIITKVLGGQFKLPADAQVTNILLEDKTPTKIVLYDEKHLKRYAFPVTSKGSISSISMGNQRVPVSLRYQQKHLITDTSGQVTLKSFRYLVETADSRAYTSVLFGDSHDAPSVTQKDQTITYEDGAARKLEVNQATGLATFDTYGQTANAGNFSARMTAGYDWIVRVRQLPDNIYYFESHDEGRSITFRLYANGLPIFNMTEFGTVRVQQISNKHERVSFSQYSLQVPLPSHDADDVTLPDSKDVLKSLTDKGLDVSKIQDLSIGYRWVSSKADSTVTLTPEWYFEVGDVWQAVNSYLANE
jgi:regulatory protein YycH of two-component signal transduction system YycFG